MRGFFLHKLIEKEFKCLKKESSIYIKDVCFVGLLDSLNFVEMEKELCILREYEQRICKEEKIGVVIHDSLPIKSNHPSIIFVNVDEVDCSRIAWLIFFRMIVLRRFSKGVVSTGNKFDVVRRMAEKIYITRHEKMSQK